MRLIAPLLLLAGCATLPDEPPGGVQVGVAFDQTGERGAFADGLADVAIGRRATPDDPVRIASISKLVVAIGVMRLVEQGKLDLDADVSLLLGHPARNPAFPDRPISLRQLLSHTSSLRDHDDQYVIPLGEKLRSVLADPNSWDKAHGPGAGYFAYANLNFPVVASVMERATGERFDRLMQRLVLAPMKLDACFNWATCSDAAVARAVVLTQDGKAVRDDLGGRRPDCAVFVREGQPCDLSGWAPGDNGALFSPQGGLRISARGLARVGRMLLGKGTLDGVRILSVEAMLATTWRFDGSNGSRTGESETICSYGLAVHQLSSGVAGCADNPESKRRMWLGHSGDAYGLRSGLWIDQASDTGIAYLVTDVADARPEVAEFTPEEKAAFKRTQALINR
jgi:CubicO group peptidase (beta-lactamase class C family)